MGTIKIFDTLTGTTKEGEYIQQPIMNLLNYNNIVNKENLSL